MTKTFIYNNKIYLKMLFGNVIFVIASNDMIDSNKLFMQSDYIIIINNIYYNILYIIIHNIIILL